MRLFAAAAALALTQAGAGAAEPAAQRLPDLVVTAVPSARPLAEVPAAISAVRVESLDNQSGVSFAEYLAFIPGLLVRERNNYAQDVQLSVRGYGARSTFGVRGLRLYSDGVPATLPDGQGQTSHFSLSTLERIEVLRGPFSALYGNSSGGVIQTFSALAPPTGISAMLGTGGWELERYELGWRGDAGGTGLLAAVDHSDIGGWRRHSAARRSIVNAQARRVLPGGGEWRLIAGGFEQPEAEDPQGLTASEARADPRQAAPNALLFNTRKAARQWQGALIYEQAQGLRLVAYGGRRSVLQFLSVPVAAQGAPTSSGGVVDLGNDYAGSDARWRWRGTLHAAPMELSLGLNYEWLRQTRRGYENFSGSELGVRGNLRRDERNRVHNFDQYAQAEWQFAPRWSALAGLRHTSVHFKSADHYVAAGNPDDSGARRFEATSPIAGLLFRAGERWRLYSSYGSGFETPTFNELAYRPDGSGGLNFSIEASRSRQFELGARYRAPDGAGVEAALFAAHTREELGVLASAGGRTTFQNVGRTRRHGLELAAEQPLPGRWHASLAATLLDAEFRDDCASGCAVRAGAALPGLPRASAQAALRWGGVYGWQAGITVQAVSSVPVNDAGSERATGYGRLNGEWRYAWPLAGQRFGFFLRADNLLDRDHTGSVIVNDANGRYYEPGAGRSWFAGIALAPG